jgi:hypothetical protein
MDSSMLQGLFFNLACQHSVMPVLSFEGRLLLLWDNSKADSFKVGIRETVQMNPQQFS